MKINFPALFQTPVHKYRFFFIFGNDTEVFERAISFLQKTFKSPLHIKEEKELLTAAPAQASLFKDQTETGLTLVSPVTDKILSHLDLLKEGRFIFTSEKARAASKLVTSFTASSESLAISAYASPLTTSEFEFLANGIDLAVPFKGLLFKAYQNDYMGLLSALMKIELYGDVPECHYESFLTSNGSSDDLSPLIHTFLLRDGKRATEVFENLSPPDLIPALRNLTRTFQTLLELMPFKKSSQPIQWLTLKPPVFFKDQPLYQTALTRWTEGEVFNLLRSLLTLERQVKFSAFSGPQIKHELLMTLLNK